MDLHILQKKEDKILQLIIEMIQLQMSIFQSVCLLKDKCTKKKQIQLIVQYTL